MLPPSLGAETFHIKKPLTVTGCPSSSIFFIQVHNIWLERTVKLSGSLWLAVIVGTKAVDHSYLDGYSRRCLIKFDKRAPLCRKNAWLIQYRFSGFSLQLWNRFKLRFPWEGGGILGSGFAGYVPLASQNPHPIIVNSVANYIDSILVTFEQMSLWFQFEPTIEY